VSFEAWKAGRVAPSESQLPVVAPPPGLKRVTVSSRLRQTLVHPDKSGILRGLRYTADGSRLVAGHARSGVVQVWDAASGRQLTRLETGKRNSALQEYFQFAPDGKSLYVNHGTVKVHYTTTKEKRLVYYDFAGGARQCDLASGETLHDFPPAPCRGVWSMQLSPDGSTLLTVEGLSGDYDFLKGLFGTLWDARTGKRRAELPEKIALYAAFSPDSKTVVTNTVNDKNEMTALLFLDADTGETRRSLAVEPKHLRAYHRAFSPDGELLACLVWRSTPAECYLKFWDVETGREVLSIASEKEARLSSPVFSPDGRILAVISILPNDRKVYLIDVRKRQLLKRISLGEGSVGRELAFSPDGRWLAAISQPIPKNRSIYRTTLDELPQPRILLIEAATGEARETIVAPSAIAVSLCFSPDGKTLASGGDGRVLLWDMTKPPGTQAAQGKK
jgi:WD40 repeat protein